MAGADAMKLAAKRLENIGWLALVFCVAILLYPLSLSVATLRSDLSRIDRRIVATKQDIRYLETEFGARANLLQLERWNRMEYGYEAPRAAQYLDGERALANLGTTDLRSPVKVAVITSMGDVKPAGVIGSVFARFETPKSMKFVTPGDDGSARSTDEARDAQPVMPADRTTRVAAIERKLLDDGLIRDLGKAAKREAASKGPAR
ncbi:MAG: hypothetical protein U5J78_06425 [Parasphingorhabdus sp.]|nr:hypothetical protein [Parasphingorhabdus sp.]